MSIWRLMSIVSGAIGARLAGAALGFLSQLMLARALAREDVGIVLMAMSSASFISLLITGGYPLLGLTYLARYQSLRRPRLVRAYFAAARRDCLILTGLAFGLIALAGAFLPLDPGLRQALVFGCLAALGHGVMRLINIAANSQRRYALSFVPDFILRPGLLTLFILALMLVAPRLTIAPVLWAFVGISWGLIAVQVVLLGPDRAMFARPRPGERSLARYLRSRAASLLIVAVLTNVFADVVTLIGGLYLAPAEVAILGIAVKVASLVGFVTQASQQFVMRDLTAAMAQGRSAEVKAILLRTNVMSLAVMIAAVAAAAATGEHILGVFGPAYRAGQWALVLFLVGQTLRAASGMNGHLLSLDGYQMKMATMSLASLAVLLFASSVLVPHWGILGMAAAAVIADAAWAVALGVLTRRLVGWRGDIVGLALARA